MLLFIHLFWMLFRSAFKCASSQQTPHTSQKWIIMISFIKSVIIEVKTWSTWSCWSFSFSLRFSKIPWKLHLTVSNSWWVWISLAVLAASTLSRSVALALETDVLYGAWFRCHGGRYTNMLIVCCIICYALAGCPRRKETKNVWGSGWLRDYQTCRAAHFMPNVPRGKYKIKRNRHF